MKSWWSKKYKLPPNHDLFSSQSLAELNQEMIEDLLLKRAETERLLDEDISIDERRMHEKQLVMLNKALGEDRACLGEDDLIDKWERELSEGKVPSW